MPAAMAPAPAASAPSRVPARTGGRAIGSSSFDPALVEKTESTRPKSRPSAKPVAEVGPKKERGVATIEDPAGLEETETPRSGIRAAAIPVVEPKREKEVVKEEIRFELRGIRRIGTEISASILDHKTSKKAWFKEGDRIDTYTVAEVNYDARSVRMVADDKTSLTLRRPPSGL